MAAEFKREQDRRIRPQQKHTSLLLWLGAAALVFFVIARLPGTIGTIASVAEGIILLTLILVALPGVSQWLRSEFLWRLRNKLILTYLLIGVAPVLLFTAIFAIASYVAVGQFAIHLATTRVDATLVQLVTEDEALNERVAFALRRQVTENSTTPSALPEARELGKQTWQAAAYIDGKVVPLHGALGHSRSPLALPAWFVQGKQDTFSGLVRDGNSLYLAAMSRRKLEEGHSIVTIGSVPVDSAMVKRVIAEGLGGVLLRSDDRSLLMYGGADPPSANLADISVHFSSEMDVIQWDDGAATRVRIAVQSRPSLLYNQLFGAALSDTSTLRYTFFAICFFCILTEYFALRMAMRLNKTITDSVEGLYDATLKIDSGDLSHRIQVGRTDQMADLCKAFNRMSSSLERLLVEEQVKERLQNEISIAQEVQANLFPLEQLRLPTLELHGVCRPARAVSGDYYDFLLFHDQNSTEATGVGIALGDISGKGISAALLMATLHSAVRAYRFASEELIYSPDVLAALMARRDDTESQHSGDLFQSPGRILSLLNRHLYRSTQPEKYATLFLAHYDVASRRLTCSNAGHLPPILLCADGSFKRFTKGGTVVGLMDGMHYDEESQHIGPGDLMIAFSDGVTEPENDFGEFGEERLLEVILQYRHESLQFISARVMEALDAWIGAEEQPDDITLVLARGL